MIKNLWGINIPVEVKPAFDYELNIIVIENAAILTSRQQVEKQEV